MSHLSLYSRPARVMAGLPPSKGSSSGVNTFSNDGSFLEQFKKMQGQGVNQKAVPGAISVPTPTSSSEPSSSVSINLRLAKRRTVGASKVKPKVKGSSVRQAFSGDSSDSEDEGGRKACAPNRKGWCEYICTHQVQVAEYFNLHVIHGY